MSPSRFRERSREGERVGVAERASELFGIFKEGGTYRKKCGGCELLERRELEGWVIGT